MGFGEFLKSLDAKYSTGKKSNCKKYNLCNLFDPIDD